MKVKNKNKNLWSLCSPWDRRPTTNFGIWRIQCLPRFVNWHFLISLAKFFPSGSSLNASTGTGRPPHDVSTPFHLPVCIRVLYHEIRKVCFLVEATLLSTRRH